MTITFDIFDEYGIDNCKVIWIDDYPCNNKKELEAREGYYIESTKCINKIIVGRTPERYRKESKQRKKETAKIYRENTTVKLKAKREEKKGYYTEYNKSRKENNEEHISEYNKQHRDNNKEK